MAKIQKQVEVEQATADLMERVAALVLASRQALKDGFQAGSDIPVLVATAWANLMPAIQDAGQLKAELAEDQDAFLRGLLLGAVDLKSSILKPLA